MKKLEVIIRSEKLEKMKKILDESNATGAMVSNIMGYGNQKGYKTKYRGSDYYVNLLPKMKVEMVVTEEVCEKLVSKITEQIATGNFGDGKIFIYNVEDAIRIRTGERGEVAL